MAIRVSYIITPWDSELFFCVFCSYFPQVIDGETLELWKLSEKLETSQNLLFFAGYRLSVAVIDINGLMELQIVKFKLHATLLCMILIVAHSLNLSICLVFALSSANQRVGVCVKPTIWCTALWFWCPSWTSEKNRRWVSLQGRKDKRAQLTTHLIGISHLSLLPATHIQTTFHGG